MKNTERPDFRYPNARALCEQCGGPAAFARIVSESRGQDMSPQQASQVVGPKPSRKIGDSLANDIEDAFGKARGWLDIPPAELIGPESVPSAAELVRRLKVADESGVLTETARSALANVLQLASGSDVRAQPQKDDTCVPGSDSLDFQDVFYPSEAARKRVRESHSDPELKIPGQNEEPKSRQRGRRGSGAG